VPNLNAWYAASGRIDNTISPTSRAIDAWHRIQANPTSIMIFRVGSAQQFRVESGTGAGELAGPAAQQAVRQVILFGVNGHPTVANSNIQSKDRFVLGNTEYDVTDVLSVPGEVQAFAQAVT
jgi:hypothetical protein